MDLLFELLGILTLLLILGMSVFMVCYVISNRQAKILRVVPVEFESGGRNASETHIFVQISDVHIERLPVSLGNIVDTIHDIDPEFILITGDLCEQKESYPKVYAFLDYLQKTVNRPIYIVYGNHDHGAFGRDLGERDHFTRNITAISPLIKVIENEYVLHNDLMLCGLEDISVATEEKTLEQISKWGEIALNNNYKLVIAAHNPDIALMFSKKIDNITALLCGHTHGGQMWMPFNFEFVVLRNDKLPKKGIYYGKHKVDKVPVYITSGLGCTFMPVRFRTYAEIAVITV